MAYGYQPNFGGCTPMGNFGGAQPYAGRLNGMEMQPYQGAPVMQQPGGISARYVTGREEAVAAQILPDGNVWVFADIAHGRMYTKRVDPQNGFAEFREYQAVAQPTSDVDEPAVPVQQYVTVDEFNALKREIEQLKNSARPAQRREAADK